jgi:hypothetical protein
MAHMASMLEQAQLIARDLRPTPAPAPMSRPLVNTSPEVVRASTPDSATEESSPVSSVPQPIPPVSLLEDSRFEEALQAFLELSHTG